MTPYLFFSWSYSFRLQPLQFLESLVQFGFHGIILCRDISHLLFDVGLFGLELLRFALKALRIKLQRSNPALVRILVGGIFALVFLGVKLHLEHVNLALESSNDGLVLVGDFLLGLVVVSSFLCAVEVALQQHNLVVELADQLVLLVQLLLDSTNLLLCLLGTRQVRVCLQAQLVEFLLNLVHPLILV